VLAFYYQDIAMRVVFSVI